MAGSRDNTGTIAQGWVVPLIVRVLTYGLHKSLGWEHYEVHEPEPHILLFKCAPVTPRRHGRH